MLNFHAIPCALAYESDALLLACWLVSLTLVPSSPPHCLDRCLPPGNLGLKLSRAILILLRQSSALVEL